MRCRSSKTAPTEAAAKARTETGCGKISEGFRATIRFRCVPFAVPCYFVTFYATEYGVAPQKTYRSGPSSEVRHSKAEQFLIVSSVNGLGFLHQELKMARESSALAYFKILVAAYFYSTFA